MKKRLLSMLMAVLMIASLVPATALAADTDNHANHDVLTVSIEADAAAKQPGITFTYCNTCDKVVKEAVVTPFVDAKDTCVAHKHVTTKVLQEGSCELAKITLTYCSDCGNPVTASGTKVEATAAVKVDKTDMGKHSYSKFTVSYKPTCTEDGWGYTLCDKCGEPAFVYGANLTDRAQNAKPVSALDYLYYGKDKNEVKTADANKVWAMFAQTNDAEHAANNDNLVTPTENVYVDAWYVPAGSQTGYVIKKLIAKAAIEPTHAQTVSGKAVVGVDGKVSVAEVYSQTNATEKWLDSDATGAGRTADIYCPDCMTKIHDGQSKNSLNIDHDMYRMAAGYYPYMDAAGVKHDGVTDTWHCNDCNKDFGGVTIKYADFYKTTYYNNEWAQHTAVLSDYGLSKNNTYGYVKGDQITINVKAATCQEKGSTGHTLIVYVNSKGVLDFNTVSFPEETDKTAHNWAAVESKEATCKSYGWTVSDYYVCVNKMPNGTLCNEKKATGVITFHGKATPVAEAKVLVEATCQSKGLTVIVDKTCGDLMFNHESTSYSGQLSKSVKYIDKVPHKAGELVNVKEATCTEKGYTGDAFCVWCNTQLVKGSETALKDHTPVEVKEVPATCTENGTKAGTKCSVCETVLSGCEVITSEGHNYVKQDDAVAATCTENGKEASEKCSACDDVIEGKVIDALGHKYEKGVCTVCGAKDPEYVAPEFKDAASIAEYAKEAVTWAANAQVVKGDDMGNFNPTANITRQDFVTMLWRLKGEAASNQALTFTDKANIAEYAATAVAWAVENGYIEGYEDGSFAPTANITRAEIVTILDRIAGNAKAEKEATFTDVVGHWAAAEIAWAAEKGVVNGVGDNKFAPDDNATRQDTVVMLYRFANLK